MNILLLTHSYPSKVNPLKCIFIREQAKVLSQYFNVSVVFFKVDYSHFGPFTRYSFSKKTSDKLTEYEVTITRSLPGITQIKFLLDTYRFIEKEILTKSTPDIIHSHFSYPGGFLATILQRRKKIPAILTEHTRIKAHFRSWFHKQCVIYTSKYISGIVTVSNALKNEIDQIYHRPITVIPNIVDTERFELVKPKTEGITNIGFLGGLGSYNKGLDLLLKSASLLQKRNYILHIGGDGVLLNTFKKIARDSGLLTNCKFYGEISRNNIQDFYSRLDIFVLPSRYETFGIVLVEAMASGIPVIATKCGGPQEIVTQSTGILVEKDNADELAKAISFMSENLGSYDKAAIRNYAKEKFGQSIFIEKITDLYYMISGKKRTNYL
ncbi:MAG: glycosyltransferase [Bacteroidales bacterium]|nr:glycosyltransferase [Bacteroidales bacterium]